MQEQLIHTQTCSDEQGIVHTFRYYLLTEQIPIGSFACENYGIRIEQVGGESSSAPGMTRSRTRVDQLAKLLANHSVSPAHLFDVIEDFF